MVIRNFSSVAVLCVFQGGRGAFLCVICIFFSICMCIFYIYFFLCVFVCCYCLFCSCSIEEHCDLSMSFSFVLKVLLNIQHCLPCVLMLICAFLLTRMFIWCTS